MRFSTTFRLVGLALILLQGIALVPLLTTPALILAGAVAVVGTGLLVIVGARALQREEEFIGLFDEFDDEDDDESSGGAAITPDPILDSSAPTSAR